MINETETQALLQEFLAGAPAEPPKETPAPAPERDAAPEPEAKKEAQVPEPKPDPDPAARAKDALLSRLHARMRRLEEERESKSPRPETDWTPARQKANLGAYIREVLKLDPGKAARGLMAEALGEDAPDEYKNINSQLRESGELAAEFEVLRKENTELRERMDRLSGENQNSAVQAKYWREVDAYVTSDALEKTHPNAAHVIRADREWAATRLQDIVREDARSKLQEYERDNTLDVRPMTAQEAIGTLDREIESWSRRLPRSPVQNEPADKQEPRKTLISTTPTAAPVAKRPDNEVEANYQDAMHWLQTQ